MRFRTIRKATKPERGPKRWHVLSALGTFIVLWFIAVIGGLLGAGH